MGPHTNFEWQHDAILHNNGLLTLFDDAASPKEESESRALKLHLNTTNHQVTLVHQYRHSPPTFATSEGSVQLLADHNVFVGWGNKPHFSEYTPNGKQTFSGSFRRPVNSYRAYRCDWVGSPLEPAGDRGQILQDGRARPRVRELERIDPGEKVAGARFHEPNRTIFQKVGSPVSWSGFQTRIHTRQAAHFKVRALGERGAVLATSAVVAGPIDPLARRSGPLRLRQAR